MTSSFRFLVKWREKLSEFPCLLRPHMCSLSPTVTGTYPLEWGFCYNGWTCTDPSSSPRAPGLPARSLFCTFCAFGQSMTTCAHHGGIMQSISSALKIPPQPSLTATDPFTGLIVLTFPECPRVGILQCVASSHWLLVLSALPQASFLSCHGWRVHFSLVLKTCGAENFMLLLME